MNENVFEFSSGFNIQPGMDSNALEAHETLLKQQQSDIIKEEEAKLKANIAEVERMTDEYYLNQTLQQFKSELNLRAGHSVESDQLTDSSSIISNAAKIIGGMFDEYLEKKREKTWNEVEGAMSDLAAEVEVEGQIKFKQMCELAKSQPVPNQSSNSTLTDLEAEVALLQETIAQQAALANAMVIDEILQSTQSFIDSELIAWDGCRRSVLDTGRQHSRLASEQSQRSNSSAAIRLSAKDCAQTLAMIESDLSALQSVYTANLQLIQENTILRFKKQLKDA